MKIEYRYYLDEIGLGRYIKEVRSVRKYSKNRKNTGEKHRFSAVFSILIKIVISNLSEDRVWAC